MGLRRGLEFCGSACRIEVIDLKAKLGGGQSAQKVISNDVSAILQVKLRLHLPQNSQRTAKPTAILREISAFGKWRHFERG